MKIPEPLVMERLVGDLSETARASADIYREHLSAHRNCLLLLEGELGAGKTAFVRSLGPVLGFDGNTNINSPTFNLLNVYENPRRVPQACDLYHYDLYRLSGADELADLDFIERWEASPPADAPARLHAIEWWQRAADAIPPTMPRYRLALELVPLDSLSPKTTDAYADDEEARRLRLYRLS